MTRDAASTARASRSVGSFISASSWFRWLSNSWRSGKQSMYRTSMKGCAVRHRSDGRRNPARRHASAIPKASNLFGAYLEIVEVALGIGLGPQADLARL